MTLKIYIDWYSQPCRAIIAFCLMTNIPHEVVETQILEGKTRTVEFQKINPLKKVPAMDDDGFILFESHAILRYLARKHNVPNHWCPKESKNMALVDRYLDWHHSYLRAGSLTTVFNTIFAPKMGISNNVDLEESRKLMLFSLKFIDEFFLRDTKFIAGNEISIADLSAACEVSQGLLVGVDLSVYKNLSAWYKKIMAIPEVNKVHQVFFKLLKEYQPDPKF